MDQRRPPRKGGHGPAPRGPRPNDRPRRPQRSAHPTPKDADGGDDRLQKVMAHAGIGSRRACEELILAGRVTVNGKIVRELGTKVDPTGAGVAVDGEKLVAERPVYYAVYKPKGYVSTNADPSGRPRVLDLLPEIPQRVYTVGRLDEMSNGLIILTNDGTLAHKLAHPKYGVEKLYRVVVAGIPTREVLNQMTEGIWLAEGKVRAKRVRAVGKRGESTILEMVLSEGKNREVRRMMAKLGHKVMSLTRIAVGPITIKGLSSGQFRPLTSMEVGLLRKTAAGEYVAPFAYDKKSPRPQRPRPEGDQAGPGRPMPSRPGLDRVTAPSSRRPATDRPSGPSSRRPATDRPSGPSSRRPTTDRPSGPSSRRPALGGSSGSSDRRPQTDRPVPRRPESTGPVTRPPGLPPSQRPPSAGRPSVGPPPSRRSDEQGPANTGGPPGRPSGPPPRPSRPPARRDDSERLVPPTSENYSSSRGRRVIGLEGESAQPPRSLGKRAPIKPKPPRRSPGPLKPRRRREGETD
jgi:23S rRNA pseudouridine2605 synthase